MTGNEVLLSNPSRRRTTRANQDSSSSFSTRFGKVYIREHEVIIGDNPACSGGAPMSLGWQYAPDHQEFSIDDYEKVRSSSRRLQCQMKMPVSVRHNILMDGWEVSMTSIVKASREIGIVREKRMKTAMKALRQQRNKDRLESTCKSLKGMFQRREKSPSPKPHQITPDEELKSKG